MKNKKIGKKLVFIIEADPYKQDILVVCNGQFEDAYKFFKKKKINSLVNFIEENKKDYLVNDIVEKGKGRLYTELPSGYVMIINHCNDWIETVDVIVHESLHATHYILQRAGLVLSKESEEAFTYLNSQITSDILKKIY